MKHLFLCLLHPSGKFSLRCSDAVLSSAISCSFEFKDLVAKGPWRSESPAGKVGR